MPRITQFLCFRSRARSRRRGVFLYSYEALNDIHSAIHRARLMRATLKPEAMPVELADLPDLVDVETEE